MRGWRRLFWAVLVAAAAVAVVTDVPAAYVLGPIAGLAILRVGLAMFGAMGAGASEAGAVEPQPVDPQVERTAYACAQCGAELVLIVRGEDTPPRHCGERMTEHREIPRA